MRWFNDGKLNGLHPKLFARPSVEAVQVSLLARVFVTCAGDSGKKRNLYCFDRRTGKQLWMQTVEFPIVEPTYPSNPYCGSTPAADGARGGPARLGRGLLLRLRRQRTLENGPR